MGLVVAPRQTGHCPPLRLAAFATLELWSGSNHTSSCSSVPHTPPKLLQVDLGGGCSPVPKTRGSLWQQSQTHGWALTVQRAGARQRVGAERAHEARGRAQRSRHQGQSVQVEGKGMPVTGEAVSLGVVEGRV